MASSIFFASLLMTCAATTPLLRHRGGASPRACVAMLDPIAATTTATAAAAAVDFDAVFAKAARAALGGGASGAAASVVQVLSLMWVRTTINYQYRNGGTATDALAKLYAEGGVGRLYQGLPYALVQAPLTRFGDVAANAGIPVLLDSLSGGAALPPLLRQIAPSLVSAAWRTIWMPVDTLKTSLQVDGDGALATIKGRLEARGPGTLWEGSLAAAATSFAGSYPWWLTYRFLDSHIPLVEPTVEGAALLVLVRLAFIGFCAVAVSDTVSNSLRVVKTTKQTAREPISYAQAVAQVVAQDGVQGLFLRGLGSKVFANGLQGALFSVAWRYFEQVLLGKPMR